MRAGPPCDWQVSTWLILNQNTPYLRLPRSKDGCGLHPRRLKNAKTLGLKKGQDKTGNDVTTALALMIQSKHIWRQTGVLCAGLVIFTADVIVEETEEVGTPTCSSTFSRCLFTHCASIHSNGWSTQICFFQTLSWNIFRRQESFTKKHVDTTGEHQWHGEEETLHFHLPCVSSRRERGRRGGGLWSLIKNDFHLDKKRSVCV